MSDRLTGTLGDLKARDEYLACPGTINYFDEDGNFVIAPNTPKYQAKKRAWEARLEGVKDGI